MSTSFQAASAAAAGPAAILFRDGLHSIFAFLDLQDLNAASQSCRYWTSAASSCPSIHAMLPGRLDGLLVLGGGLLGARMTRHIGDFTQHDRKPETLEVIFRSFPNLTYLNFCPDADAAANAELPVLDPRLVPSSLRAARISLWGAALPAATRMWEWLLPLLPTSLRELHLDGLSASSFHLGARFRSLKKLELRFGVPLPTASELVSLLNSSGDTLECVKILPRTDTLEPPVSALTTTHLRQLRLSRLRVVPEYFQCAWEDTGFLAALAEAIPMLESVTVVSSHHPSTAFSALSRFPHLREIVFRRSAAGGAGAAYSDGALAEELARCRSLTRLSTDVKNARPLGFTPEQWNAIFASSPSLTQLVFLSPVESLSWMTQPAVMQQLLAISFSHERILSLTELDPLLGLPHLTELYLRRGAFVVDPEPQEILSRLEPLAVLPRLRFMDVGTRGQQGGMAEMLCWSAEWGLDARHSYVRANPEVAARFRRAVEKPGHSSAAQLPPPPPSPPSIPAAELVSDAASDAADISHHARQSSSTQQHLPPS
jgi:hypothetical protein